MLRDLLRDDPALMPVYAELLRLRPDLLLLTRFDYDYDARALQAFGAALGRRGLSLPHLYAPEQNRGRRLAEGQGALLGPGRFYGDGAMALLSRYPIRPEADFSLTPWGAGVLSSAGHWQLEIARPATAGGPFRLLAWSATSERFSSPARVLAEAEFWAEWPDPGGLPVLLLGQGGRPGPPPARLTARFAQSCAGPRGAWIFAGAGWHLSGCETGAADSPQGRWPQAAQSARLLAKSGPGGP